MAKKEKRGSGSALDLAMAAFAGTAAGFVIFAMPNWQFDRVVELSGLPLVLSAAQPPLGITARIAAVAAAVTGTWALVWLVLRALSKQPVEPRRRAQPVEIEVAPPRLRRADAHPDAPSRRPILAGLELGRPLNDLPEFEQPEADLTGAEAEALELVAEEAQEDRFNGEEVELDPPLPGLAAAEGAQVEESEPEEAPEIPEVRDSMPPAEPAGEHERASIGHLMQRLELGLLRREHPSWAAPADEAEQKREAPREIDQRLRSAIEDLQRLAARSS